MNSLPLLSDRKQPAVSSTRRLMNSISVKSTNKKTLLEEGMHSRVKKNLLHGEIPRSVLEKTPLEELFESTVEEVREKRKGKKVNLRG